MPSAKQKRIGKKGILYMMEYREKKKDLIQLSNNEYYKCNEFKIKNSKKVNYEENTEH